MHEMKQKVAKICEMKETLISWMKDELSNGKFQVDTKEAGEVIDMIKDLTEAEEKCWKACYYKCMIEEMMEEDEGEDEEGRRGYNNSRYANGRYAPKGRGTMRGYIPNYPMMPPMMNDGRMGYVEGISDITRNPSTTGTEYGKSYDKYADARRHYTQSHAQRDKDDMDMHANQHIAETMASMREIWKHADPEMKNRMKTDLTNLVNELK